MGGRQENGVTATVREILPVLWDVVKKKKTWFITKPVCCGLPKSHCATTLLDELGDGLSSGRGFFFFSLHVAGEVMAGECVTVSLVSLVFLLVSFLLLVVSSLSRSRGPSLLWLGNLNKIISQSSQEPADYFVKKRNRKSRGRQKGNGRRGPNVRLYMSPCLDNDQQTNTSIYYATLASHAK